MKTHWTDRVVALHPFVVTGFLLAVFLSCEAASRILGFSVVGTVVLAILMTLFMELPVLWWYSLYRAASNRITAPSGAEARRSALSFTLLAVASPLFVILGALWLTNPFGSSDSTMSRALCVLVPGLVIIIGLNSLRAIWSSAGALIRFDEDLASAPRRERLGTFILLFYYPIGIWFLYPRIRKMLAAEPVMQSA
jgi:hypothetical protein